MEEAEREAPDEGVRARWLAAADEGGVCGDEAAPALACGRAADEVGDRGRGRERREDEEEGLVIERQPVVVPAAAPPPASPGAAAMFTGPSQ